MNQSKKEIRRLVVLALMIAIMVIFSHFIAIETEFMKFSFTFIPEAILGALFGPWWSLVAGVIADFLGMWLAPKSDFFFGFTLNAAITGFIYGYFCHKKPTDWKYLFLAILTNAIVVHLILTPLWLHMMYGIPFWVQISTRLLKEAISIPLQVFLLTFIMKRLPWKKMKKIIGDS